MTMQKTVSGNILRITAGSIAKSCCCSGGFVPTLDCGTSTNGDPGGAIIPSMVLRVTASDVNMPVTWCGKTWVASDQEGVKSTEPQEVCPSSYELDAVGAGGLGAGREEDFRVGAPTPSIHLYRYWGQSPALAGLESHNEVSLQNLVGGGGARNVKHWGTTYTIANPSTFTPINAAPRPTINNYRLTDDFFTSYTVGGVTYEWARGTNW